MVEDFETKEELDSLIEKYGVENIKLIFYFKFGTDGSSGHLVANQVGSMNNCGKLMSSNLIILQLVAEITNRPDLEAIVLFTNQLFNSEISNRPIHHWHVPENTPNLKKETKELLEECRNLVNLWYGGIPVELVGFNSMNDQKCLYSILGIACTRRCVCGILNNKHMKINQQFTGPDIQQKLDNFVKQMCVSNLHFALNLNELLMSKYCLIF